VTKNGHFILNSVFRQVCLSDCILQLTETTVSKQRYADTISGRNVAQGIYFWQYKIYADVVGGFLERSIKRQ